MDFIGGLPKAQGKDTILVVVDRLTEYDHFFALSYPCAAKEVAELFIKEVVRLHGFLASIVSDRDRLFMSLYVVSSIIFLSTDFPILVLIIDQDCLLLKFFSGSMVFRGHRFTV